MNLNKAVFTSNNILSSDSLIAIQSFVESSTFPVTPSFVFDTQKSENVVNQTVRNSKTLHVKDPQLLAFVESQILIPIMEENSELNISLARDYVTFIKYDVGGFFDWHVDFEKVTINGGKYMKEMHLLFCIQAPNEGGELLLKKDGETLVIQAPKTLNSAVIFDKLLEHRAEEVKAGQKIIMTVDVFVSTIYSDLSEAEEQRLIDFSTGKTDCFSVGSFEQFSKLYTNIEIYKPEKLWEWIPYVQIRVESSNNIFEIDFIGGVGITRFEKIDECRNWDKGYKNKTTYYKSQFLSRLNFKIVEDDDFDCQSEHECESKGEGDCDCECNCRTNSCKCERKKTLELAVETVDAQTQQTIKEKKVKKNNYSDDDEPSNYEKFCNQTEDLFLDGGNSLTDAIKVIYEMVESEHDDFSLRDHLKHNIHAPPKHLSTCKVISLPECTYFKNDTGNYEKDSVGFSYHCNESNYDTFDIKYRYGLVRFDESMTLPSKPAYLVTL